MSKETHLLRTRSNARSQPLRASHHRIVSASARRTSLRSSDMLAQTYSSSDGSECAWQREVHARHASACVLRRLIGPGFPCRQMQATGSGSTFSVSVENEAVLRDSPRPSQPRRAWVIREGRLRFSSGRKMATRRTHGRCRMLGSLGRNRPLPLRGMPSETRRDASRRLDRMASQSGTWTSRMLPHECKGGAIAEIRNGSARSWPFHQIESL